MWELWRTCSKRVHMASGTWDRSVAQGKTARTIVAQTQRHSSPGQRFLVLAVLDLSYRTVSYCGLMIGRVEALVNMF
jgi:hypothetical protein